MDDILSHSERVTRDALRGLMVRSDGPGLARLLAALGLLVTAGTATCILAAHGDPWWLFAATLTGLTLPSFFAGLHEAAHGTAFRSQFLNKLTTWIGAPLMLQAPSFFREFHWEHHRQTQNPSRDPEIALGHGVLGAWPKNPLIWLVLASGQALLSGKAMFTLACALLPAALWRRLFPFVHDRHVRAIAWESRLVLAGLAAIVAAGLAHVPGFWALLLAWPIGHVFLGLYLLPEHTGLPADGTQLHRTRTLATDPAIRWWMWNMPYHGEHHAYPAVPFHALPRLHDLLEPELEHADGGYLAFHLEALLRSLTGRR
jgi:fatty acid desaturase